MSTFDNSESPLTQGGLFLTIASFLEIVEFDRSAFFDELRGNGEPSGAFLADRDSAFETALEQAKEDVEPEDGNDDALIREQAMEAVAEWEAGIVDFASTCVEYPLADLLAAYRAAHGVPGVAL